MRVRDAATSAPVVGYSNGLSGSANRSFEYPGSHVAGAFLDSNTRTGLRYQQLGGSGVNGRLLFQVANGTTITPVTIASLSPSSAPVGSGAVNLTITGTGFASGAAVNWTFNGQTTKLPSVVVAGSTQIACQIPANLLTAIGTAQVVVANAAGSVSNQAIFTIGSGAGGGISGNINGIALDGGSAFTNSVFQGLGSHWDTLPSTANWILGVSQAGDAANNPLLNNPDKSLKQPLPPGSYYLFDADPSARLGASHGQVVQLTLNLSDGSTVISVFKAGPLTTAAPWTQLSGPSGIALSSTGLTNVQRVGTHTTIGSVSGVPNDVLLLTVTGSSVVGGNVSNSTIFGNSCVASFVGQWHTSFGAVVINPPGADGFLTSADGLLVDGFVIGRVLTAWYQGSSWIVTRWLISPDGNSLTLLPEAEISGNIVPGTGTRDVQHTPAVACGGTNTAALWVGQWNTNYGYIRSRLNLDGTVTVIIPPDCAGFTGGVFTGTPSGLTLAGTYAANGGGTGNFSLAFPSNDIGVFSGSFSGAGITGGGSKSISGKSNQLGYESDYAAASGFVGRWYTNFGLLTLKVTGNVVTGTYPLGSITGTLNGSGTTLSGTYSDTSGTGTITLTLDTGDLKSQFHGVSTSALGLTAPWLGGRAGDWSGTWKTNLGSMTATQMPAGGWVGAISGLVGTYTLAGTTERAPSGGGAWSGMYSGPFSSLVFNAHLGYPSQNDDGLEFNAILDGYTQLGIYGNLSGAYLNDTIGPIDTCPVLKPVMTVTTVAPGLSVNVDPPKDPSSNPQTAPVTAANWAVECVTVFMERCT